jgi:hypothetical protein
MLICGHDFTLYVDYDRGNFWRLDFAGKILYMRARVDRDLIRPCRTAIDCQHRVAVGLLVPGLVCAGISAAATFLNGERAVPRTDQAVFVRFIRDYMHADLRRGLRHPTDQRVADYADWLYCYVRCGLTHAFALEWGHIEGAGLGAYIGLSQRAEPQVNQNDLVDDFARAWNAFLDAVAAAPRHDALAQNFARRFDQVFHD